LWKLKSEGKSPYGKDVTWPLLQGGTPRFLADWFNPSSMALPEG